MSQPNLEDKVKRTLVFGLTSLLFYVFLLPTSHAACTSSQQSQIRQAETRLAQMQRGLSRESETLSKVNIKINDLQQKITRYAKSSSMKSLLASTQRQLDSAIREQGQAMRKVVDAQKWVDRELGNLTRAQNSCR